MIMVSLTLIFGDVVMKAFYSGSSFIRSFENKRTLSTFAFWIAAFNCILMVYGLNTWLPKIMQQSGYGLSSSLSLNLISGIGQIGGSIIGGYLVGKNRS